MTAELEEGAAEEEETLTAADPAEGVEEAAEVVVLEERTAALTDLETMVLAELEGLALELGTALLVLLTATDLLELGAAELETFTGALEEAGGALEEAGGALAVALLNRKTVRRLDPPQIVVGSPLHELAHWSSLALTDPALRLLPQ